MKRHGFTLVEIMIVVAIIGVLATIAIPSFVRARRSTQISTFINDLRILADGMNQLAMNNRGYPPDLTPGLVPAGLDAYTGHLDWTKPTPVGGLWDWDYQQFQFGGLAGFSVYRPRWSDEEMTAIDARIDDGALGSGNFRKRPQGYIYYIEQ